jgi:hypothetical protein
MLAAEKRAAGTRKSFRIALAVSMALHALVILYPLLLDQPLGGVDESRHHVNAPLQARIQKRAQVAPPQPTAPPKTAEVRKSTQTKVITSKKGTWSTRSQPQEEKKPSGSELAQRALSMARGMGRTEEDAGEDVESTRQEAKLKEIEPLSLEWYFNGFITKLNRSARFVERPPASKGQRAAEVQLLIGRDGRLVDYKIIRAADRQIEVAYIEAVARRAAPFAAFPDDIAKKTDILPLTICIQPPSESGGGGFTRTNSKHC